MSSGTATNDDSKTTTSTTTITDASATTSTSTILSDNPCWGNPEACSLTDLLRLRTKDDTIVHESSDYLAIHKPPDLRMDGEYRATVHKLLTYWYPPPSLLERVQSVLKEKGRQPQEQQEDNILKRLLQTEYHNHGAHPDNELRPVHQLDYATSGLLLVARNRAAANHAREAFDQRRISKQYLALVQSNQVTGSSSSMAESIGLAQWPCLESVEQVQQQFAAMEHVYRRRQQKQQKRKSHTFQGYQPPASLFQQWQQQEKQRERQLNGCNDDKDNTNRKKKRKKKHANNHPALSDEQWKRVWDKLYQPGDPLDTGVVLHSDMNWKQVKQTGQAHRFERAAQVYNEYLVEHWQRLTTEQEEQNQEVADNDGSSKSATAANCSHDHHNTKKPPSLPMAFRIRNTKENTFFICASIAEVPDQFAVTLNRDETLPDYLTNPPPSTVYHTNDDSNNNNNNNNADLNFKPSLTQCTILKESDHSSSGDGGMATTTTTTKVALVPWSGRRHQLRIHMALLGLVIVGDQTYDETQRRSSRQRMCLHAHKLKFPLPKTKKGLKNANKEEEADYLNLEAPDPF